MQNFFGHLPSAMLASGLTLAAATSATADPDRYIPVLEQRAAILDCRYKLWLRGRARFGAEWPEIPSGGQAITWILPGPGLSPSQTDKVNECADEQLGRHPTPRFAPGAQKSVERKFRTCPKYASVLFGGSTYCIKRN